MRRERILVVEDDRAVREVVSLCLSDGYEVTQATTGAEALRIVRRELIAAVVLDYRLPDRSGLEVLTEIRSAQSGLPVIMMTGYGSEHVCASAFRLGIRDYFPKPLNVFDLRQSVRRILMENPKVGDEAFETQERELCVPAAFLRQADMAIQKAAVLIQQRYWDHLTLSGLAHEVGMSKYRLSHRFREIMGVTLRGYLLRVRLERAKETLAAAQASITEVALAVGFGDLPRFDKLFKRYTGVTPSAYRNQAPSNK
jgi:YesN/AraC family two-component response regulator